MKQIGANISRHGLKTQGINNSGKQFWNLTTSALYQMALANGEAELAHGGALVCRTGVHTGRSANDKFIVREPSNEADFDWGKVNKPIEPEEFDVVLKMHLAHYEGRDLLVQDLWAGADKDHRLAVRVVAEQAWHTLFARNMFIIPTAEEQASFEPQVKIASSEMESEEKINQRVRQALEHIDKERLILAPDCGLSFLPKKLCLQKLKIMKKVAKSFIN